MTMVLPRFNGNQLLVKQEPYDLKYFKAYVEYFRDQPLTAPLRPATNWRFLVPYLASKIPFDAVTSINLVNCVFLILSLVVFYKTLELLKVEPNKIWQSLWLFILSFPMFYYSTIGYVDASLFFFIALSIYFTITNKPGLFLLSILLGLCVKETVAMAIPFYLFYHLKTDRKKAIYTSLLAIISFVILFYLIKKIAPVSIEGSENNFWKFDLANMKNNFFRINTWLSFILSFGFLGLVFLIEIRKLSTYKILGNQLILSCLVCMAGAFFFYSLSYFSTVADGRVIWLTYFYLIIIWNTSKIINSKSVN
jgi:predicted membrane-bound dolichyl-phosphate-mannose-protein mannosyltransferase